MATPVQILRSYTPGNTVPDGRALEGELYTNFPDKSLGVIDPTGAPQDLLPIRFFSEEAKYKRDDVVFYDSEFWKALSLTIVPGPFNIWDWESWHDVAFKELYPIYYADIAGDDDTGDGSETKPWRTIQKAIDYLKKFKLNNIIRISVSADISEDFVNTRGLIGPGTIVIVGAGSTSTTIRSIFVSGNNNFDPTPVIALNKLTIMPLAGGNGISVSEQGKVWLGDVYAQNNDLVISMETGTISPIVINGGTITTSPAPAGTIEYRMFGKPYWSPIYLGQHNGPNKMIEGAKWIFTGTPDTWTSGYIGLLSKSDYIVSGSPSWTGTPGNGPKFVMYGHSSVQTNGLAGAAPIAPGGLDFFPGTLPGTMDGTCYYDGKLQGGEGTGKTGNPTIIDSGATKFDDPTLPGKNSTLVLNKDVAGTNDIIGAINGSTRWSLTLGNDAPETAEMIDEGSDFHLNRWDNTGRHIGPVLRASRSDGLVTVAGDPTDPLGIATKQYVGVSKFSELAYYTRGDAIIYDGEIWSALRDVEPKPFYIWDWNRWHEGSISGSNDFYITVEGSDETGDGTEEKPYRTIDKMFKYFATYTPKMGGAVTVHIGPGDDFEDRPYSPNLVGITATYCYLIIEGSGSAQTILRGLWTQLENSPGLIICINNLTLSPRANTSIMNLYGSTVVLGDMRGENNDLVISTEGVGTDAIVLYRATVLTAPAAAGVIEYRMFGIGHWGPIIIGQFGGPNNWTDGANWIFTGTPDTWSHGWIMMYEGTTYSASGTVTFTGTPGNGRKFEVYGSTVTTGGCQGAAPAPPGGIDFFPGTTPGVWDANSTYDGVAGTLLYNADESRKRAEKIIGKIKSDFDALVKNQGEKNDRQRSLF